jgi:glycosyltransferase involved in cell wall biosynthesis
MENICNVITTLDPRLGGAGSATIEISKALSSKKIKVTILTNDNKNSKFFKSNQVKIINLGNGFGNYNLSLKLFLWIRKNRKFYDTFIFHGLWQFNTLIARFLLKDNFYVFSHGQLDPYFATEKYKKIKKKIYWNLVEKFNMRKAKAMLLTNNSEKKSQEKSFVNVKNLKRKVINFGINAPKYNIKNLNRIFIKKFNFLKNKNYFIFLGRFHKKKGCDILIKSFKNILKKKNDIFLLMIGPHSYEKVKLKNLSNEYKLNDKIFWSKEITNDLKWIIMKKAQAMVLSSRGENFGVSLVESLSVGTPVITTSKVNIQNIIKKSNCGYIGTTNEKDFTKKMLKFINLSKYEKKKLKTNSLVCFNKYFNLKFNMNNFINTLNK